MKARNKVITLVMTIVFFVSGIFITSKIINLLGELKDRELLEEKSLITFISSGEELSICLSESKYCMSKDEVLVENLNPWIEVTTDIEVRTDVVRTGKIKGINSSTQIDYDRRVVETNQGGFIYNILGVEINFGKRQDFATKHMRYTNYELVVESFPFYTTSEYERTITTIESAISSLSDKFTTQNGNLHLGALISEDDTIDLSFRKKSWILSSISMLLIYGVLYKIVADKFSENNESNIN